MNHPCPSLQIGQYLAAYPIVQGAMAVHVSGARLAAAVANAGGVGIIASLGLGLVSPYFDPKNKKSNFLTANRQALIDELTQARTLSPVGILGVNVLVATRDYGAIARTAAHYGADLIVASAGVPLDLPEHTAEAPHVALVPVVSGVDAVRMICETWKQRYNRLPDGFIVENCRVIGGHFGTQCVDVNRQTFDIAAVLSEIRAYFTQLEIEIPLIVAGGIWDHDDVMQMLAIGANGVQVGTRLITTEECDSDRRFKEFHLNARTEDVVVVPSPVGKPARALRNRFTERAIAGSLDEDQRCVANCLQACLCRDRKTTYCIIQALAKAAAGDVENGLVFTSARVAHGDRLVPVADVIAELVYGAPTPSPQFLAEFI